MNDKLPHIILGFVVFITACIIGAISGCSGEVSISRSAIDKNKPVDKSKPAVAKKPHIYRYYCITPHNATQIICLGDNWYTFILNIDGKNKKFLCRQGYFTKTFEIRFGVQCITEITGDNNE